MYPRVLPLCAACVTISASGDPAGFAIRFPDLRKIKTHAIHARIATRFGALLLAAGSLFIAGCSEEPAVFEALPPHLEFRLAGDAEDLAPAGADVARGLIGALRMWPPETTTLSVCFFRGGNALRGRI